MWCGKYLRRKRFINPELWADYGFWEIRDEKFEHGKQRSQRVFSAVERSCPMRYSIDKYTFTAFLIKVGRDAHLSNGMNQN